MLSPRWVAIGFVTLLSFNILGIWQTNRNTDDVRKLNKKNRELTQRFQHEAVKEAYDNCYAINTAYQVTRFAKKSVAEVQIDQMKRLRDRFEEANKLNPPQTEQQQRSYENGHTFFNNVVKDIEDLADAGTKKVYEATRPLNCKKP